MLAANILNKTFVLKSYNTLNTPVTDKELLIRGWVRKFCHRYYNFVNKHDRWLYYTLIERATFLLYNDVKIMPERNKYLEIDTLKDTWGKTNDTFSRICEYYCVRFMRHIIITTDQIFSNFSVINNSIFRKAM